MVSRLPPNASKSSDANFDWKTLKEDLSSPILWSFAGIMMFEQTGTTGLAFWLPTIIQGWGLTTLDKSQLLAIPPAIIYVIASVAFAYFIDHNSRFPKPVYMLGAMAAIIRESTYKRIWSCLG